MKKLSKAEQCIMKILHKSISPKLKVSARTIDFSSRRVCGRWMNESRALKNLKKLRNKGLVERDPSSRVQLYWRLK